MELEISKHYSSYSFHPIYFIGPLATTLEHRVLLPLTISQVLKMLWHLEILKYESVGES